MSPAAERDGSEDIKMGGTSTPRTTRKWAVEPVETSSRSSTKRAHKGGEEELESKEAESKPHSGNDGPAPQIRASGKYTPQPFEESSRSNRKQNHDSAESSGSSTTASTSQQQDPNVLDTTKKPARRKFAPQLIETAQRSRKAGDASPAVLPQDRTNFVATDASKHKRPARPLPSPTPPYNTPTQSTSENSLLRASPNRQGSTYPHYNTRQHSFKVPDLEAIESSESSEDADSNAPSLSRSSSPPSAEKNKRNGYKDATRRRESLDDRFSGYLLSLAARAAEKQLRDQAEAAFPNSDFRDISQQVNHFVDHEDSDEEASSQEISRNRHKREQSADEAAALRELQKHGANLKTQKQSVDQPKGNDIAQKSNVATKTQVNGTKRFDPWATHNTPKEIIGGHQRDPDLKQMRKAASPPMLGGDIDFPRCPSPENARFDVTQGADFLRQSLGYDSNQGEENGLWAGGQNESRPTSANSASPLHPSFPRSAPGSISRRDISPGGTPAPQGLWNGLCTPSDARQSFPSGIMTPMRSPQFEIDDPSLTLTKASSVLSQISSSSSVTGPRSPPQTRKPLPTPPPSQPDRSFLTPTITPTTSASSTATTAAAPVPDLDTQLATEFPNEFITQVYNYLSLGFPALARKYDDELSRISGVSLSSLQDDDKLVAHRGYLRLGDAEVTAEEAGIDEESCARWRALRIYCREWGKQMGVCEIEGAVGQKGRGLLDPHRAWGLPGRKGSWGN